MGRNVINSPKIILFRDYNFQDSEPFETDEDENELPEEYNDKIKSYFVANGRWVLYPHKDHHFTEMGPWTAEQGEACADVRLKGIPVTSPHAITSLKTTST